MPKVDKVVDGTVPASQYDLDVSTARTKMYALLNLIEEHNLSLTDAEERIVESAKDWADNV